MRLHPRTQLVDRARIDVEEALDKLQNEHDLTYAEMLTIINHYQAVILRFMLRMERHPNKPDKGADEA